MKFFVIIIMIFLNIFNADAFLLEKKLPNESMEQQSRKIFTEIRCVVCSGQSIADSDAELAKSLRMLIRKKVSEGFNRQKVLEYISGRYGDEILLEPPVAIETYILWFGQTASLILGIFFIIFYLRKRS